MLLFILSNFKSFQKAGYTCLGISLLLLRCHQMELTSGCYTVLCHCAYAQNLLTAKLRIRTGSRNTGVPLDSRPLQPAPSLTLAEGIPEETGKRVRTAHP